MRKLLLVSIFLLSTILVFLVFFMFKTTPQYSNEGCGVTGCALPQ